MAKRIIHIIFFMLLATSVFAQVRRPRANRDTRHYFYNNVTAGYSIIFDDFENTQEKGGFASILGLGYSFMVPSFWFEVGAEMQSLSSSMSITDNLSDKRLRDTEGDEVIYHYNKDLWYERQDFLYVGVPVMFGYHHYKGFSIGGGFKYSINVLAVARNYLQYSTSATYSDYIDDFENMPNHFYGDYDMQTRSDIIRKVNRNKLAVCLEVGYIFYNNYRNYTNMRDRHVLCRLSGYFEYAVNSLVQNREDQEMYMLNPSNPAELMNVPYYLSNSTRNKRTTPFVVGFRWTYTLATISCRTCR